MQILKIACYLVGALYVLGGALQIPIFYDSPKARPFVKKIGKKTWTIVLIIMGLVMIGAGFLINV